MSCMRRDNRVEVQRDRNRRINSGASENSSKKVFLDYALNLAQEFKFKETFSVLAACCRNNSLQMESVREVGDYLIEYYRSKRGERGSMFHTDPWSCCICATVIVEPATLPCGHTICKKCLLKDISGLCKKCGAKYDPIDSDPIDDENNVRVSILVSQCVDKYWTPELQAVELRNEGTRLFQRGEVEESIAKYSEALKLSPEDHLVMSNRSHAYYRNKQFMEALRDADMAIAMKPDWGKGYFRRGMALVALDRWEQALIAYFQCLVFEENCSKVLRDEIHRILFKLLSNRRSSETEDLDERSNEGRSNIRFFSQPDLTDGATSLGATNLGASNLIKGSTGTASDSEDSESETETSETVDSRDVITIHKYNDNKKMLVSKNRELCKTLDILEVAVKDTLAANCQQKNRDIDPRAVDPSDFDCSLCFRLLWQPSTTPCGHTYCKPCIDRSLDHKRECPLCKTEIKQRNSVKMGVCEFVEETIRRMLPSQFAERQKIFEEEMNDLIGSNIDGVHTIPVFVCTMAFPYVPCPLHVFEPRYRLMIRRTMETGTREFGMATRNGETSFSDYGTMLEIRDIQYFADGRSVVDTVGSRRFKVLSRSTRDGYNIADVEFLHDVVPTGAALTEVQQLHDRIHPMALKWFSEHDEEVKRQMWKHYGSTPTVEHEYWTLASGPAWYWWMLAMLPLDSQAQQQILSQTVLKKRLDSMGRILYYIMRRNQTFRHQ